VLAELLMSRCVGYLRAEGGSAAAKNRQTERASGFFGALLTDEERARVSIDV